MAERIQEGATWKCSQCGGFIRSDSPHCKHCKVVFEGGSASLPTTVSTPKPPQRLAIILSLIVGAVVLAVFLYGGGGSNRRAPPVPDRTSAWVDCRSFVEQNLKAPASAVFPLSNAPGITIAHLSNGRWSVLGFVDAENSFGAMLRQDWGCQISYSGARATLHQLRIGDQVLLEE
jgi:hypothetical protein